MTQPHLVTLDPSWPAPRIAAAILNDVSALYGDALDVRGMHDEMAKIWDTLQVELTAEERARVAQVAHVAVPLNDLGARIATPPSHVGHFILFDAMLDLRIWEVFTAPRDAPSWVAAYVRAAWSNELHLPHWVGPAMERLTSIRGAGQELPDSYSLSAARDFILAHEYGHLLCNHLAGGPRATLHFGGEDFVVFDAEQRHELDADAFARDLLGRGEGRPLAMQQMGADWLFGFLGAVLTMRRRVARYREGDPDLPTSDAGIERRRALCRADYERRRAASGHEGVRLAENSVTIDRVRQNVDNFNAIFPAALADIYAECPDELLKLTDHVVARPMTADDIRAFHDDLARLGEEALRRQAATPRRMSWRRRFKKALDKLF